MEVKDKRKAKNDEDVIGNFRPGVVVEFDEGLSMFTSSLKGEYKTGFILKREMIWGNELPEHQNCVPVAFFSGEFMWINAEAWVRCVNATVEIDHYEEGAQEIFINIRKKMT